MRTKKIIALTALLVFSVNTFASNFRSLALQTSESDLAACLAGTSAMVGLAAGVKDSTLIKQYTEMLTGVTTIFNKVIAVKGNASKTITERIFTASVKTYKHLPYSRKLPYAQDKIKSCEKLNELARAL